MVSVLSRTVFIAALSLVAVPGWAAAQPAPDAPAPAAEETAPAPGGAAEEPAPATADAPATEPTSAAAEPAPPQPATAAAPAAPSATPAPAPAKKVDSTDTAGAQGKKDKKSKKGKKGKKKPWKRKPNIRVGGRVFALYMMRDRIHPYESLRNDVPLHEFRVSTARVGLEWSHGKLIDGEVSLEATEESGDSEGALALLRDAYVRIKPMRELKVRMGQFKKPFSRLELTSRNRLRLIDRGISNEWIIEELGYGDRDIGLQLEGRFGKKKDVPRIEYQLGVFNGAGRNYREEDLDGSMDLAGRVEVDPTEWLSLGLNASHKTFDPSTYDGINLPATVPKTATAGGADFLLELERLRVHGEALLAHDHFLHDYLTPQHEQRNSLGALLLVSYKHRLTKKWRLAVEPLAKGEVLDPDTSLADSHVLSGTVGVNLHVGRHLRLMLQADRTRTSRDLDHEEYRPPFGYSDDVNLPADEDRLLFQVAFQTR